MAKGRRRSRETPGGDRARSGRARAEAVPDAVPPPGAVGAEPVEAEPAGLRATLAESRFERSVERRQAELRPIEDDGVRTVAVITVLWAVAFVVLALQIGTLEAQGRGWWLWTCLAGVGLGLLGLEYTRKRRDAIEAALDDARAAEADEADAEGDMRADVRAGTDVERPGDTGPVAWPEPAASEPAAASEPVEPGLGRPHSGPGPEQPSTREGPMTPEGPAAPERPAARERLPADTTTTRPIDTGHGDVPPVRDTSAPVWPAAQPSRRPTARPRPPAEPVSERERFDPGAAERPSSPRADDPGANPLHDPPSRPGPTRRLASEEVPVPQQPEQSQELPPEPSSSPPQSPDTGTSPGVGTPPETAVPRAGAAGAPLSELFGDPRPEPARSTDDDEPLLDTTLGGGHAARRHDAADTDAESGESIDTGEISEGRGRQYRGRRARRSDTA